MSNSGEGLISVGIGLGCSELKACCTSVSGWTPLSWPLINGWVVSRGQLAASVGDGVGRDSSSSFQSTWLFSAIHHFIFFSMASSVASR
ncbi:hypothetical protein [Nostoc sp.]|uniref:hypothetical protein n=1 Tax=Nostoc sp. TaxID=1180 RepID=UPI002FFC211F